MPHATISDVPHVIRMIVTTFALNVGFFQDISLLFLLILFRSFRGNRRLFDYMGKFQQLGADFNICLFGGSRINVETDFSIINSEINHSTFLAEVWTLADCEPGDIAQGREGFGNIFVPWRNEINSVVYSVVFKEVSHVRIPV